MGDIDDLDLERTDLWTTPPPRHDGQRRAIVAGVAVLVLVLAGLAWWMRARQAPGAEMQRIAEAVATPARPSPSVPRSPVATELPSLDELDPTVRELIGQVTSSPLLTTWLATGNLTRQVAALVDGEVSSRLSLRSLAPLRPTGSFSVVQRQDRTTIAPASYARYDALASLVASLDTATVVRVYRTLAPRLEEAHAELGEDRTFDGALRAGLTRLAQTPVPEGPIAVVPRGGLYAFADPRLEALSPAQKLLLRSGPANARRIQAQLAAIAAALGPPTAASTTP
jgi:hypothetical protein